MHNQKGVLFLAIIIVVVVAALLGTAGYFAYKQYFAPKSVACTEEAKVCPDGSAVGRTGPNCEFAECPAVPNQTASWKTYTNSQYGFEFRYPGNLLFKEYPVVKNWSNVEFYDKNNKVYLTFDINSSKDINKNWENWGNESVIVGGISGNRVNTSPANTCYNIVVEKNGVTYLIGDACLHDLTLFNQILSTFKFTK